MKTYFVDNGSEDLILFFLGWGMDEKPMLPLKSKKNILYLFDYSELSIDFDFSKYSKIYLITYSAGVSIAPCLELPKTDYSIAINGTSDLFDDIFGLKSKIVDVFKNISMENYMEFRKNFLVKTSSELERFNDNAPYRTIESSIAELLALQSYTYKKEKYSYDKILISKDDKIFPINIQKDFWGEKAKIIKGGHFPFYNFSDLDEIFQL